MGAFPLLLKEDRIELRIVQVAILLIVSGLVAVAQDAASAPPAPPLLPAVFANRIPADQLTFLNDYVGRPAKEIQRDKRYRVLMKAVVPHAEYHYGRDMPLSETVETLLDGDPLPIDIREGRYAMVASHGGPYLSGKGFVWFDMHEGIVLGGVYFHPTNGEPTPTLAIFSRQLADTDLAMSQLPAAFEQDLAQWVMVSGVMQISPRYFIPASGKKYVLVHDEDYCAYQNGVAVTQDQCQQMNAEAADADVNAAYFMQQTHNAANATAWMLGPDQVAWIGVRDQSCGLGPVGLGCRIRITRQRTRVLLGPRRN